MVMVVVTWKSPGLPLHTPTGDRPQFDVSEQQVFDRDTDEDDHEQQQQ